MEAKKKRLTLDLDPAFQRRLKVIAALKGVSMRGYCQAAIDRELTKDEASGAWVSCCGLTNQTMKCLRNFRRGDIRRTSLCMGTPLTLIREAREIRDAETEEWT